MISLSFFFFELNYDWSAYLEKKNELKYHDQLVMASYESSSFVCLE